jgi:transposase-like protein
VLAVRWYCGSACPTATSRSYSPSAASTLTTSPCTAGFSGSPRWPAVWHHVERYANNRVEADHAQLKRRLRPMRGIKTMTGLRVLAAGHAFVQNLRRGHYEIAANQRRNRRLPVAFCELATAI